MKQFNEAHLKIINHLSDGSCQSGTHLGQLLGLSRTAIWKQIKQLIELGVPIQRLPQKGYQLPNPISLLNENAIRQQLNDEALNKQLNIHLFASLDSTNRYLKNLPIKTGKVEVCCAELQTKGRGRFDRLWYSPFGENLYCSSRWPFDCDLSRLSGLSLVVSLAIREAIKAFVTVRDVCVKWPNDLMHHDRKLCGTLIEIQGESHGQCEIIIGIGLNVNSLTHLHPKLDTPWCSLREISGNGIDRNHLVANLILTLNDYLDRFMKYGLVEFKKEWADVDYLYHKIITVSHPSGGISGRACGINDSGQLCLENDEGMKYYLSTGDTSLKRGV